MIRATTRKTANTAQVEIIMVSPRFTQVAASFSLLVCVVFLSIAAYNEVSTYLKIQKSR